MLTIEPSDPAERSRLRSALGTEPSRILVIRCARGCELAQVGVSSAGIVFKSKPWEVALPVRHEVHEGDVRLRRKDAVRKGYTDNPVEVHSTLALLDEGSEHVDLLVRCQKHGDAVLTREQIMRWLRDPQVKPTVGTGKPRLNYHSPRPWGGEATRSTFTRTIEGDPLPLDAMREWLGWDRDPLR